MINQCQNAETQKNGVERAVRNGGVRRCFWFDQPDNVKSEASSKANFFDGDEKCIEVNLSALPKEKRRPVWDWMQANRPELAKMLGEDPQFLEIKAAFNCAVKVDLPVSVCKQLGVIRR